MTRTVNATVLVLTSLFFTACESGDELVSDEVPQRREAYAPKETPMTKQDLEDCLTERYGEIEESQSLWVLTEEGSSGAFTYKLPDGGTIRLEGYATGDGVYYVDPSVDCLLLQNRWN